MRSKLIVLILILLTSPCFALGNKIDTKEYPDAQQVLPKTDKPDFVIEGSVEKNIDMTLDRCIEIALGNNPQIAEAFNDILASDTRIKQVWANYFPQASWQTGYTRIRNLQLSDAFGKTLAFNYWLIGQISLQQMLYDFGVTQNQVTLKKLDYEAYKSTLGATVNNVVFETKDAYYNLLYAFEARKVALDTVKKFEMFYNQAKAFYEIGTNPKVDVTIAEVNLSNAKMQLIAADNAVNLAVAKLNNVMGVPFIGAYDVQERLQYKPLKMTFDDSVKVARESRPELKLAELKVESARQTLQLVKKSYYPQIVAEAQYMEGGKTPTSNHGYNYGAYLNFPTVNAMLIRNQVKEARFLYDREVASAKNMQNQIYLEIQTAYLALDEKRNQIPVAALGVKQAKESYELSFGRYRVGEGNPIELRDAQTSYQQAQLQYYNALYQYNSAKAALEKAVGRNIVEEVQSVDLKE